MRIFQDIFSNDEIISDSYKMEEMFEGTVVAIKSRMIVKGDEKIDVGCGDAFGGKNEEDEEGGAGNANVVKVIDLVDAFHYKETSFGKEDFLAYYKSFAGKVMKYLQENKKDRVEAFKKGAVEFRKFINEKFDELSFYTPESYDA